MSRPPTWLITGTSSGLGLSLSQHILQKGHNLISISRHTTPDPSLLSLSSNSNSKNTSHLAAIPSSPTLHHIPLDLSNPNPTTIPNTLSTFLSTNPNVQIDYLINNAAITLFDAVENTSPTTLSTVMTTNFFSPVYLIQSLLLHMRTSNNGHKKVIVNVSSTQGLCTDPSEMAYDASKHALEGMSGVLAAEVASFGIRVMLVELGSLRTGFASAGEAKRTSEKQREGESESVQKEEEEEQGKKDGSSDPYADPDHPVAKRMAGVRKLADVPGLARGDPGKTAAVLFDAVVGTEGSVVEGVLDTQRKKTLEDAVGGGSGVAVGRVERLVLGSDAQPKIERVLERLRFDVKSCRVVSGLIEADK